MQFKFYFLKEGTRVFDRVELITFLSAQQFVTISDEGTIKKAYYKNNFLGFDACFVLSNRGNIENIQRLNPKFLDTNVYVEFNLLSNEYKVSRLLDIVKQICTKFEFAIYNELFEDVIQFDKAICLNALKYAKTIYQKQYEDDFVNKPKMSTETFKKVYSFLEVKDNVEESKKAKSMNYLFVKETSARLVYLTVDFSLVEGTIIPPGALLVKLHTKDGDYYAKFDDVYKKISKYCETLYTSIEYNILYISDRNIKKVNKILTKTVFDRPDAELEEVPFESILDF